MERDLTGARNEVNTKTRKLRDQLTRAQMAVRKQLTDLTIHGNDAAKTLQEVINKVKLQTSSSSVRSCDISTV